MRDISTFSDMVESWLPLTLVEETLPIACAYNEYNPMVARGAAAMVATATPDLKVTALLKSASQSKQPSPMDSFAPSFLQSYTLRPGLSRNSNARCPSVRAC